MPRVKIPPRQPFYYMVNLPKKHFFILPLDNHDDGEEVLDVAPFLPQDYLKKADLGKGGGLS